MLLQQVSALNKKHDEIARITGEKFNIFSILGVESRETSTHTAFLVELLKPKGSHGLGKMFLDLFLEMLKEKEIPYPELATDNSTVFKEKYIGPINHDVTKGGQLDILVEDKVGNAICIENKIYAEDQKNQLIRYSNFLKKKNKGLLLYLTLNGNEATEWSTEAGKETLTLNEDYFTISYKKDILSWLQECQKAAVNIPSVREGIGHYIKLIKKLTGQSMSHTQKNEFIELITKKENQKDFIKIKLALDVFLKKIEDRLKYLDGILALKEFQRKPTELWNKNDQLSKLNSVLFVPLNGASKT